MCGRVTEVRAHFQWRPLLVAPTDRTVSTRRGRVWITHKVWIRGPSILDPSILEQESAEWITNAWRIPLNQ